MIVSQFPNYPIAMKWRKADQSGGISPRWHYWSQMKSQIVQGFQEKI